MNVLCLVSAGVLYLFPTWVGYRRSHHHLGPIFIVNLFLGWTFLGWVAAFALASSKVRPMEGEQAPTVSSFLFGVQFVALCSFLLVGAAAVEAVESRLSHQEALKGLSIGDISWRRERGEMAFYGVVRNRGYQPISRAKVEVEWMDANEAIIETDWGYAVGHEPLSPGRSRRFVVMTPNNPRVKKATCRVIE